VNINDKECAAKHGVSGAEGLVLFRKFDNSPLVYSDALDQNSIVNWLTASSVPTLMEFSEEYIEPIFGQKNAALFLFRKQGDADSDFAKVFEKAAHELKGEILFIVTTATEGI